MRYLPVPSPNVTITDDYALVRQNGIVFAISDQYWTKEPQNLSDYFSTFYIMVRNVSNEKINVSAQDIYLVDENQKQYDIVLPENLYKLMDPDSEIQDPDRFPFTMDNQQEILQKRLLVRRNLNVESYGFGEIIPGANKSGFIYFNRLPSKIKKLTIYYKNTPIPFEYTKQ